MKFTDLFIRRPVVATVLSLLILVAGLQSIRNLNVRQYPRSDIATVTVKTYFIGAAADLVRGFITTPLEKAIASADGIDYLESQSAQGLSIITVHLKLNYDTNAALTQIQSKLAQVRNDLPPEAQAPTIELQMSDSQYAIMYISFDSDSMDPSQVTDYLTRVVQPKLTAVSGVQKADILGARLFAMRIWLKSDRMAALNLSPSQVQAALAANNYLSALGTTKGSMTLIDLIANTDLHTPQEFSQLVVRQQNGAIVRLSDIADVELGAEDYDMDVRFNGKKAVFMGIWVMPTANSLDVIDAVRATLKNEVAKQLPSGMKMDIPYDGTRYIRDALKEVIHTLSETLLIVVIVIFLFLGSLRAVIIPVVAIPISLIGAAFLMLAFGFTINLLTLLAIVLSVGLVVDDAIVVVENVERHLHLGEPPHMAALKAARELIGPIIAMTITLAAVYAPIGIQGGLTGTLFREFAFTLAGAVIVSGVVALTLSPMMSSQLLRAGDTHKGFAGWINRRFEAVRRRYMRLLMNSLRWRPVTLVLAFIIALLIAPFYFLSLHELAPKEDQGVILGIVNASPNSTIEQTARYTEAVNEVFQSIPENLHTFQLTQPFTGFGGMGLVEWSKRHRTADQIVGEVFMKTSHIGGIQVIATTPEPLPGGSQFPVEFIINSTAEPREIVDYANQLVGAAFGSGKFMFADTDLKYDNPRTEVVFDRDKVAFQGLNLGKVGADLSTMLGGNFVNRFAIQGRSYKVIPQVKRGERLNPDQLQNYYVSGPDGKLVQLSTFATLNNTTEPRTLNRFQQLNSAKIQGVNPPGITLDESLKALEATAAKILPKGFSIDYGGTSRQLRTEGSSLTTTMIFSIILIFLVLAAQFESFRDPFIILLGSVPLALSGALMFSFLGFTTLNIYSQVGLITLVGLVAKNGILIVEFANHLQETGLSKVQAVTEAAGTRLRPILMTSVATVAGHFPLVIASGPGAAARNSIGIMLVSGMVVGTILTLFVLPSIYVLVARTRQKVKPEEDAHEVLDEVALEPAGV